MDGQSLENVARTIFDGAFPIQPQLMSSWDSSAAVKFCKRTSKTLTRNKTRRIATNIAKLREPLHQPSLITRMIRLPTVAMGDFVPTVSRNQRWLIVR